MFLFLSFNKPKCFYTQVTILYLLWRPFSFVTQLGPRQTDWAAVIRDLRSCHRQSEKRQSFLGSSRTRQHSQPHIPSSCRMKWMTCLALNVSLIGQQVPIWVSSAGRLEQRRARERKKKHLIRRLGIGSGKELHAILDQSCRLYFLKEGPLIINSDLFLWACTV